MAITRALAAAVLGLVLTCHCHCSVVAGGARFSAGPGVHPTTVDSLQRAWGQVSDYLLGYQHPGPLVSVQVRQATQHGHHHTLWDRSSGQITLTVDQQDSRLQGVVVHEVTHVLLYVHLGYPLPPWLDEGLATMVEAAILRRPLVHTHPLPWPLWRLQAAGDQLPPTQAAYNSAAIHLSHYVRQHLGGNPRRLLPLLRGSRSAPSQVAQTMRRYQLHLCTDGYCGTGVQVSTPTVGVQVGQRQWQPIRSASELVLGRRPQSSQVYVNSNLLLDRMAQDPRFRGPQGPAGPVGSAGAPGGMDQEQVKRTVRATVIGELAGVQSTIEGLRGRLEALEGQVGGLPGSEQMEALTGLLGALEGLPGAVSRLEEQVRGLEGRVSGPTVGAGDLAALDSRLRELEGRDWDKVAAQLELLGARLEAVEGLLAAGAGAGDGGPEVSHYVLVADQGDSGWSRLSRWLGLAQERFPDVRLVDKGQVPFKVDTLPQVVVYDTGGRVAGVRRGYFDVESLLQQLYRGEAP